MSQPQKPAREVLEGHLGLIDEVIRQVARRHRLRTEEVEDFASSVLLRLIENDYKILRSFRGKSSLRTYLVTVVYRLFLDDRGRAWGKWRPSAEVLRLGKKAEELDRLLSRDGRSLENALEILQGRYGKASRDELLALALRMPESRARPRRVGEEHLQDVTVDGSADEHVVARDREVVLRRTRASLARALRELPAQELLLLQMRYRSGFTVRKIAATLQIEDRSLYRMFQRCVKRLRASLERQGVSREDIAPLIGEAGTEIGLRSVLARGAWPGGISPDRG